MVRLGSVLFAVGAVCTLVAVSALLTGAALPGAMWFLAMLVGAGFLLVSAGLWRTARHRSGTVRAMLDERA